MIPKIIHYIWLGKGEKPKIFEKCFASWKKFCPDWDFMLWDESNIDIDGCLYVKQAYDAKKYAFASDVIRFQKLYEYGGVYLDVDVELLKPIDNLLDNKCFMGFEAGPKVAPGLIIGSEKNNEDFKNILDEYSKELFVVGEKLNTKTVCDRIEEYYMRFGLKKEDKVQNVKNTTIYSSEYFCPINTITNKKRITKNTYSIHWYLASWYSPKQRFKKNVKRVLNFISFGLFGVVLEKIRKKRKSKWQVN